MDLKAAAEICGMDYSTYKRYELKGDSTPSNLAMAVGMIVSLGMSMEEANRRFRPYLATPISVSDFAMSDREEKLIQWFDQQFESCLTSKKPLARFALLQFFFYRRISSSIWPIWKDVPSVVRWLEEKHGVKYTKQSANRVFLNLKESFEAISRGIEKTVNPDAEVEKFKVTYHPDGGSFIKATEKQTLIAGNWND